jgi:hypothetical protein
MLGKRDEAKPGPRRALTIAQQQQARWWELRAATTLAKHWHDEGKNLLDLARGWTPIAQHERRFTPASTSRGPQRPNVLHLLLLNEIAQHECRSDARGRIALPLGT